AMPARPTRCRAAMARSCRVPPSRPRSRSGKSTFAITERRSSTGFWNTIAWPKRRGSRFWAAGPSQATRPALGRSRPCISRSSRLLPAPLGPRMMVGGPGSRVRLTPEIRSRPPAVKTTSRTESGSRVAGECIDIASGAAMDALGHIAQRRRRGIDADRDGEQHDAERHGEREVAAAGFQRDGRGHRARVAGDIAADDDDGADLGDGTAETGQYRGAEAVASVPDQRRHGTKRRQAEGAHLFLVFAPQVGDNLPAQRRNDGRDEDDL